MLEFRLTVGEPSATNSGFTDIKINKGFKSELHRHYVIQVARDFILEHLKEKV